MPQNKDRTGVGGHGVQEETALLTSARGMALRTIRRLWLGRGELRLSSGCYYEVDVVFDRDDTDSPVS